MEDRLRGVWRIDLGCFVVLGDYENSPLKDLRAVWRKDLGEYGCRLRVLCCVGGL